MRRQIPLTMLCATLLAAPLVAAGCGGAPASQAASQHEAPEPAPRSTAFDLAGVPADPFSSGAAVALIFMRTDCPIARRYAPEIQRLHAEFAGERVAFYLVFPDPDESAEAVRGFLTDFALAVPSLRDPMHVLVDKASASVTPEAAVFDARGAMIYRGRIDDRFVNFGVARSAARNRDLEDVLTALAEGRQVAPRTTKAVGCFIVDLK